LILMQLAQFVVTAWLGVITWQGAISPLALYIGSLLLGILAALEGPARQSIIPNLVPRAHLTSAIALNSTQRQVASIVGPSAAGISLAASGAELCYLVNSVSWLVMIVALLLIRGEVQEQRSGRGLGLGSLREGFSFVWSNPVILTMMALDFGQNLFGMPRALFPVYARDILGVGPEGLGLLYAASSCGAIVVALGLSVVGSVRRAGLIVLTGVAIHAICLMLFAYSNVFWFSLLMIAGEGFGNAFGAILRNTINQLLTPDELRGRVSSVSSMFTNTGPHLGQFRSGAVAQVIGPEMSVLSGAAIILLLVGLVATNRSVRTFELPTEHATVPRHKRIKGTLRV
jgi:MFS family permease